MERAYKTEEQALEAVRIASDQSKYRLVFADQPIDVPYGVHSMKIQHPPGPPDDPIRKCK